MAAELQYLILVEGKISKILLIVIINHYGCSKNYQYKKQQPTNRDRDISKTPIPSGQIILQ